MKHANYLEDKRPKRRRDSLEAFFFVSSGVYLITLGLPIFLHPSNITICDYASNALLTRHKHKSSRKRHVSSSTDNYLRPSKQFDASIRRVVFLDGNSAQNELHGSRLESLDKDYAPKFQDVELAPRKESTVDECVPMAKWQTMSFPTCNLFHETNIFSSSRVLSHFGGHLRSDNIHFNLFTRQNAKSGPEHALLDVHSSKLLGNGWFRNAWKVTNIDQSFSVAMKTLRLDREYLQEYYELHRRDAVAMERLTNSPYVMNIYGHCGNSAITELAFGEKGIDNLYRMAVGLRDNFTPYVLQTKLQIAAMVAMGLSHVHNVPGDASNSALATISHYDFNPRNVIISSDGTPKINDFNCAEFLSWSTKDHEPCGFKARFFEPWWRSPEEMTQYNMTNQRAPGTINEKVDIYSLGNTLYVLLTGLEPRGKEHKQLRFGNISIALANGEMPEFSKLYADSTDSAIVAMRQAITKCWEPNPDYRVDAVHIAQFLYNAVADLKRQQKPH